MEVKVVQFCFLVLQLLLGSGVALLYPRESQYREVKELNGLWHFRADYSDGRDEGFTQAWYKQPLSKTGDTIFMPVPSSYNDITQDTNLRDFLGWVWYDRQAWVPRAWLDGKTKIMLRLESAHYNAMVWVNGVLVANHSGGHLPFEGDVTDVVTAENSNTITVAVNNTLTPYTIPPGTVNFGDGHMSQKVQMDFFNYAGIQRPVKLYAMPKALHVDDITVTTSLLKNGSARLDFALKVSGTTNSSVAYDVQLMGRKGEVVASNAHITHLCKGGVCDVDYVGHLIVDTPNLWWPWTMNADAGYLYVLQVNVSTDSGSEKITDIYRQPVGLRTVRVTETQFLINEKPFYFHGVGKHEDANIRGKGLDYALLMKDVNLMMWLGVNGFRTSHYPYAEELMDLCDKFGIVVIDELPAVGLNTVENFSNRTLKQHLAALAELVARDKNRPAVVMWSLANEPTSAMAEAEPYFKTVAAQARVLDPTRPVTFACNAPYYTDKATQFMDVVMINRYYGWYNNAGYIPWIEPGLSKEIETWYNTHHKPLILSEYGAGAIDGFHKDPPVMYTEEYQAAVYTATFPVFDKYRKTYFVGELVWNFADFETQQTTGRADGNKKGLFTRERQPKLGAWVIRTRYQNLAKEGSSSSRYCYGESPLKCDAN